MAMNHSLANLAKLLVPAALAFAASGCGTNSYNRENSLGNVVELESITSGVPRGSALPTPDRPDAPSVRAGTLSRDNWAPQSVFVPLDGTTHRPTYSVRPSFDKSNARKRGDFPTVESSLVTSTQGSATAQAIEGLKVPFRSAAELVMMPVHMFQQGPFTTVSTPTAPPARYNYPGGSGVPADGGQFVRTIKAVETPLPKEPVEPPPAQTGVTTSPAPVVPAEGDPAKPGAPSAPDTVWIYKDGKWRQVPKNEAPVTPR